MTKPLDPRLAAAASFVRQGAAVADIGTDHAYLPLYLLERGIARFAVVSDINRGPLERARKNASQAGLSSRMRFVLTDGLTGLEPERDGVDDILICGMGGELIARIIGGSEYPKKPGVRLILGPMSSPEELRGFLADSGFRIVSEKLAESGGKRYPTILAEYDGIKRTFTPCELLLGPANIEENGPLFRAFAREWLDRISVKIEGRRRGGLPTAEDEALRDSILSLPGIGDGGSVHEQESGGGAV